MKKERKKFSFAEFYNKFGVVTILVIVFIVASVLSPRADAEGDGGRLGGRPRAFRIPE